jgi:beta-lactam-binding protein with PASTA domain
MRRWLRSSRFWIPSLVLKLVVVPRVVGDTEANAVNKLSQSRLKVGQVTRQETSRSKPGIVFRQEPVADAVVLTGSAVDL